MRPGDSTATAMTIGAVHGLFADIGFPGVFHLVCGQPLCYFVGVLCIGAGNGVRVVVKTGNDGMAGFVIRTELKADVGPRMGLGFEITPRGHIGVGTGVAFKADLIFFGCFLDVTKAGGGGPVEAGIIGWFNTGGPIQGAICGNGIPGRGNRCACTWGHFIGPCFMGIMTVGAFYMLVIVDVGLGLVREM